MKKLFILIICLYSTILCAKDDKPRIYLSWQQDPTTTMTIQWLGAKKNKSSNLYYRLSDKHSWTAQTVETRKLPEKVEYLVHKVELTNLSPNAIYQFHFGDEKQIFSFRTMPKDLNEPVQFAVGGDAYRSDIDRFRSMSKQVAKRNPRFAIIGGDIAYAAPKDKDKKERFTRWLDFFEYWTEDMRDSDGCLIPLLVGIGNHEVHGRYDMGPKNAPFYYALFERGYYEIKFANYAQFIFLDSGHTSPIKGEQRRWLENTLMMGAGAQYRFATYHVGAYPGKKSKDKVSKEVRKAWCPLFDAFNVDACFECHNHLYKRTHPLRNGKIDPTGVVYMGDGSWGVEPREPEDAWYLAKTKAAQQVLSVELAKNQQRFTSIGPKGQEIDTYVRQR